MLRWNADFTLEAEQDLKELDKQIRLRALKKIVWLKDNVDSILPSPLTGQWQGFFKLRIGDWRVIYDIEYAKRVITIHRIGHRNIIYKVK